MRKNKGFSLLELILVMAIIAIIIAITIPSFNKIIRQSSKSKVDQAVMEMNSSIVHNVRDYNGLTAPNITTLLDKTLTPILKRNNDLLSHATTISYCGYYYDDITPVKTKFLEIYNSTSYPASSDDYKITVCMPDNVRHTDTSITFNLKHPVYIIVKTVDNTYIYKNGNDVTSDFLPSSP